MKTRGFTLIELLVVISIVSLLSSVAMYSTAQARMKAEDAKKKSEIHQIETAISIKKSATGKVPKNYNCSGSYCAGGTGNAIAKEGTQAFNASMQELVSEGYISAIPDSRDDSYTYFADASADKASFGAPLQTGSVQTAKNSCSIVPATSPYSACGSVWYPDPPQYTGPGTVQFTGTTEVDSFCNVYGSPLCYPNGNGQHANACRQQTIFLGNPTCYGAQPITYEIVSCLINPNATQAVCAGGGNDFCACVQ